MPKPVKSGPKIHLVTIVYDFGVMHMWTSLLNANDSLNKGMVSYNLREEALLRFRCFAGKHLVGANVGRVGLLSEPRPVASFPGRYSQNKAVTDVLNYVLNYFGEDAEERLLGKLFVWGMPSKRRFRWLEGPVNINSKENPKLFPKVDVLRFPHNVVR